MKRNVSPNFRQDIVDVPAKVDKGYERISVLIDYIHGELDPDHADQVANHILECPCCRKYHDDLVDFLDPEASAQYEREHPEELARTGKMLDELLPRLIKEATAKQN